MVAVGEEEFAELDILFKRGRNKGVLGLHRITVTEMRKREPLINPNVSGALFAETGCICYQMLDVKSENNMPFPSSTIRAGWLPLLFV